jgi:dethiobiotin synthetase
MSGVFITGTDTEVGKTVVCGLLARYLMDQGQRVITQKWIQTGAQGFSEDLLAHLSFMGKGRADIEPYASSVCPYLFERPASAHLAAEYEQAVIEPIRIKQAYHILTEAFDTVLVEGLGGALVPYSRDALVLDIVTELALPVCVVVHNKLGAVNHTLLTLEALRTRGLHCLGLIYNDCPGQDDFVVQDNPRIIQDITGKSSLGNVPWLDDHEQLVDAFNTIGQAFHRALNRYIDIG